MKETAVHCGENIAVLPKEKHLNDIMNSGCVRDFFDSELLVVFLGLAMPNHFNPLSTVQ